MDKRFYKYLFAGVSELKITNLTSVRQRQGESVNDYIQRFRDVRSRCYSLNLTDPQLAELAFHGLLGPIKDIFSSQEFESLSQLVQRVSAHESRFQESRKEKIQRVSHVQADSSDFEAEHEMGLAEWSRNNKKTVFCPWVKEAAKKENVILT